MIIKKKIWPEFFEAVKSGRKKFELRLNDFKIKEGDILVLEEWDPVKKKYTGQKIEKSAGYIFKFKPDQLPFWPPQLIKNKGLQIVSFRESYSDWIEVILRAIIFNQNKILLNHSPENPPAYYYLPGGHLEKGETCAHSLARELKEEIGAKIKKMKFLDAAENFYTDHYGDHHEVNLLYKVDLANKNPRLIRSYEDHICVTWLDISKLSAIKLLPPGSHQYLIKYYKQLS